MLTCRSLRGAVVASGLLLVAAWAVEIPTVQGWLPPVSAGYVSFLLLGLAVALLGLTFLRSLLPKNAARLARCEH